MMKGAWDASVPGMCFIYLIYYYCIVPCCIPIPVFMQLKFVVFLLEWHGWKWDSYFNSSGILNGMARLDSSILSKVRYRWLPCYTLLHDCCRLLQVATAHYRFVPKSYRLVHKGGLPHGYHYYKVYISLLTTYLFSRWAPYSAMLRRVYCTEIMFTLALYLYYLAKHSLNNL